MSSNVYTAKFMEKVPLSPVRLHIERLHEMAYFGGIYGSALEMVEHHLYSIAVFASVSDPIREGIREEVRREFLETVPILRIPSPQPPRLPDLSGMNRAVKAAAESMLATVEKMQARQDARLHRPPVSERVSETRYKARIENERKLGLAYVRSEARRVRQEMGL